MHDQGIEPAGMVRLMLSAEELLTVRYTIKEVSLPDRNGVVCVRALLAIEQLRLDVLLKAAQEDAEQQIALQCAAYLCTAEGGSFVSNEQAKQLVSTLTAKDVSAILRAGTELNRMDDARIEATAKN